MHKPLLLACGLIGCVEPERVGVNESAVISGDVIASDNSGVVEIVDYEGTCSGTLVTNGLVLTAAHCFNDSDRMYPTTTELTMGKQTRHAKQLMFHPSADVAIVVPDAAFVMNGSSVDFQVSLYPLPRSSLTKGELLTCEGYGETKLLANNLDGQLRTADLPVRGWDFYYYTNYYDLALDKNSRGQFMSFGDSGGPCFKTMPTGEHVLVGVVDTVYNADGTINGLVSSETIYSWYTSTVFPRTDIMQQWGQQGDIPMPMDWDGDGFTDFVVWRPSNGVWYVMNSVTKATYSKQWGQPGDVPVKADFDHDGRPDIAVWRPSTGVWWVVKSSTGATFTVQWGQQGDIPVPGDYDGDGRTDFAVWRPSTGTWWVLTASGSVISQPWGIASDVPVPGDYDHDGKTDIAVWRPSTGAWFIIQSSTWTSTQLTYGALGDIPTTAQLPCGHVGVWRPSFGEWWISGFSTVLLGQPGDVPVMGSYSLHGAPDYAVWHPENGTWYVHVNQQGC